MTGSYPDKRIRVATRADMLTGSGSYPDPRLEILLDAEANGFANKMATVAISGAYPDDRIAVVADNIAQHELISKNGNSVCAFECEQCESGYTADILNERGIKCPGCGAWATFEQLKTALDELEHKYAPTYFNATGTNPDPRIEVHQDFAHASWQGINRLIGGIPQIENWRDE